MLIDSKLVWKKYSKFSLPVAINANEKDDEGEKVQKCLLLGGGQKGREKSRIKRDFQDDLKCSTFLYDIWHFSLSLVRGD